MNKLTYNSIKSLFKVGYLICWIILVYNMGQKCNANIATQSDWFSFILYNITILGFIIVSSFDDLKDHISRNMKVLLLDVKLKDLDNDYVSNQIKRKQNNEI